jgi:tripartite-type tricarboxylate transporter receptor subunit TctC
MQDLLAGRIDFMFDLVANSLPHIKSGNVKAFAVLSKKRQAMLPDIPTADEAGLPDLHVSTWQAIWAPKATPTEAILTLNAAVAAALTDPAVRQRLTDLAQEIPSAEEQTPDALARLHKAEIKKWWPIIKAANVKAE